MGHQLSQKIVYTQLKLLLEAMYVCVWMYLYEGIMGMTLEDKSFKKTEINASFLFRLFFVTIHS